jgi:hypothetical protein
MASILSIPYDPEIVEVSPDASAPPKSYIVPKFDNFGKKKVNGEMVGGSKEAEKLKRLMLDSMQNRGSLMPGFVMTPTGPIKAVHAKQEPLTIKFTKQATEEVQNLTKPKKGKKAKLQEIESLPIMEETMPTKTEYPVTFIIESGKIKGMIDAVLEDELFLALVFNNEGSVTYVPEQGSPLKLLLPDKRQLNVVFSGSQLDWYNTNQQILLFLKQEKVS